MIEEIEITSNTPKTDETPSETADKGAEVEAQIDATSSVQAQDETAGLEAKNQDNEASDDDREQDDIQAQESKPKKKSGIQRLKERHAREMAELRRELELLKAQAQGGKRDDGQSNQSASDEKPRAEDFETHEEFVEALADWKFRQYEKIREQKSKEIQARESYQTLIKAHNERIAKFKEEHPDYDDVITEFMEEHGDVHFSVGLEQAILESEMGPAVIFELVKEPEEFKRINSLTPLAAAREVGKIEARIVNREASKKKIDVKPTTKAPPPPNPLSGTAEASGKKSIYDPGLSQEEYEALRMEEMRKKRRWA